MGACCSSIAAAAGVQVPQISDDQTNQILTSVGQEMAGYAPKFSIAYCACLCKEDQKHMERVEIEKLTKTAIKLADDPDFDATTVAPPKKSKRNEDQKAEAVELASEAVEDALDDEDEPEEDIVGGVDANATSKTVSKAVVNNCGNIRADMIEKSGQPEVIVGPMVDVALGKAVDQCIDRTLKGLAVAITREWKNLIKQKKNPKKVFVRAQKIAKTLKDIKAFLEDVANLQDDVDTGADPLTIAKDAKGVASDANDINEDREALGKRKKHTDNRNE